MDLTRFGSDTECQISWQNLINFWINDDGYYSDEESDSEDKDSEDSFYSRKYFTINSSPSKSSGSINNYI